MKYYLAKTEPHTYSIDDLKKAGTDVWDGVRNFQAVAYLKKMEKGDKVLIYHSGEKAIVGLAEMAGNSRPDPKDNLSWLVDLKFVKKFDPPFVTLEQIKNSGKFSDFKLVRQGRLSVMEVPEEFISWLKTQDIKL